MEASVLEEGFEYMLSNYGECTEKGKLRPFEFVVLEKKA